MNIAELHTREKAVSATSLFKSEKGNATAIQILQGELLKEHISKVDAILICLKGEAVFENEKGVKQILMPGDYIHIEPMVKHQVKSITECQLVLFK